MQTVAAGVSDVGRERDHNEDRFVLVPESEVYVVADGMGGHRGGEVASRIATSSIAAFFRTVASSEHENRLVTRLGAAIEGANRQIFERALRSPTHRGMGTTVVVAAFHRGERKLYVAHAGDSRCYRMRGGTLSALTRDHSLVEDALRARPDMTRAEVAYLPTNVITRALGVETFVEADISAHDVILGDVFLLCSDGLHGFVTDVRIGEILKGLRGLSDGCSDLVAEANKNGGGDNITAVLIRLEAVDDPWSSGNSIPPAPNTRPSAPDAAAATPHPSASGARPTHFEVSTANVPTPGFGFEDAPTEATEFDNEPLTRQVFVAGASPNAAAPDADETPPADLGITPHAPCSLDEPTVTGDDDP